MLESWRDSSRTLAEDQALYESIDSARGQGGATHLLLISSGGQCASDLIVRGKEALARSDTALAVSFFNDARLLNQARSTITLRGKLFAPLPAAAITAAAVAPASSLCLQDSTAVHDLLKEALLAELAAAGGSWPRPPPPGGGVLFSQVGQDLWLARHVLRTLGEGRGVFVEAGAADGVTGSNTLWLERERGWTGLCVEPHPDAVALLRRLRPSCIPVHAAVRGPVRRARPRRRRWRGARSGGPSRGVGGAKPLDTG